MARPSNAFVALLSLTAAMLLCCAVALVYLLAARWQQAEPAPGQEPMSNREICLTPECVALGAFISKSINLSVDPCDDFYQYACGNFGSHVHYKFQEDGVILQGVNYVETMTTMRNEVLDRLHEVLTIPLGDSDDEELETVHGFTRSLYQGCQAWWHGWDGEQNASAALVDSLLTNLLLKPEPLSRELWPETLLARIASTGVGGLFQVTVSKTLVETMLSAHQPNSPLRDLTRVHITVNVSAAGVWGRVHAGALEHLSQLATHLSGDLVTALRLNETIELLPATLETLLSEVNRTTGEKAITRRVRELKEDGGAFRWGAFFDGLMLSAGAQVDDEALVSVTSPRQTETFLTFLGKQGNGDRRSRSAIQTLLVFDWLLRFHAFLPAETSAMLDEASGDVKLSAGAGGGRLIDIAPFGAAVGRECMRVTRQLLQPVVESLYHRAYLPSSFAGVQRLIGWVKMASADAAQSQTAGGAWMTEQSRVQVAEKILAVRQAIGFEELPPTEVKRLHTPCIVRYAKAASAATAGATLESSDYSEEEADEAEGPDFASIYFAGLCAYQSRAFQALTPNFTASVFGTLNPLVVNAYNYFHENRVIFPLALLQPPLYHPSYPLQANMAGLGFIAGHEIGHAFDSYGHTLRKDGASGHVWDEATERGYLARMRCLREDYSGFQLVPGLKVNAQSTLSNDIADVIGVSAAYRGLVAAQAEVASAQRSVGLPGIVAQLTGDQLFFVQLAQSWCVKSDPDSLTTLYGGSGVTHSPNPYRVHGMMRHSPHFAAAFSCGAGAPMNPKTKCTFW